jgi:hypothetical protein
MPYNMTPWTPIASLIRLVARVKTALNLLESKASCNSLVRGASSLSWISGISNENDFVFSFLGSPFGSARVSKGVRVP